MRDFFTSLRQSAPKNFQNFRNSALSRRENGQNFLTYIQSEQYAELGDPKITKLGRKLERLHVGTVLLAIAIVGYYYALLVSFFLSHS